MVYILLLFGLGNFVVEYGYMIICQVLDDGFIDVVIIVNDIQVCNLFYYIVQVLFCFMFKYFLIEVLLVLVNVLVLGFVYFYMFQCSSMMFEGNLENGVGVNVEKDVFWVVV